MIMIMTIGDHESRLGLEEGPPLSQGDRYSSSDNPELVWHYPHERHQHSHHDSQNHITIRHLTDLPFLTAIAFKINTAAMISNIIAMTIMITMMISTSLVLTFPLPEKAPGWG